MKLLDSKIIRQKNLKDGYAYLKTRKLWKFFWFYYHFRKFPCEFYYIEVLVLSQNQDIPVYIKENFSYTYGVIDFYTRKFTIKFSNINDIWKIRLSMFLKN